MRAVKSVSIDSERRVIITFLDGSTETLYPNCIWCDAEALKEIIKELLEEKADAIVQTINNVAVASFEDGADEALIRKLLVAIEPIQEGSGDPSPDNVRPISGRTGLTVTRTGKNLSSINERQTSGSFWGTELTGMAAFLNTLKPGVYTITNKYRVEEGPTNSTAVDHGSLYITASVDGTTVPVNRYSTTRDSDPTVGEIYQESSTFTLSDAQAGHIAHCYMYCDSTVHTGTGRGLYKLYDVQLEIGSAATDYEPYKGNTFSVNCETEAGTVYGGTLDAITGKLIVNKKLCKISDLTFTYNSQYGRFETTSLSSIIKLPPNNTSRLEGLTSSIYTVRLPSNTGTNPINNTIACVSSGSIYIRDERYDDVSDFISGVGEQTIMYPLAEPAEFQLSPQEITTLLGTNNIWADSGNILELEYVADTKLYIGESQSGTLGSGRQTISNPDLQPVSEKTWEDVSEAYKVETEEKQTQEETEDERGE